MNSKPKVIFTRRELHMIGNTVAVCWNLDSKQEAKIVDGRLMLVTDFVRVGEPYIDFVDLRLDRATGETYEDEDSPLSGGLSSDYAKEIITELQWAVQYIEQQNGGA